MDTFRSWMWIVEEKISALSAMIPLSTGISHPSSRLASGRTRRDSLFIFLFFWRDRVCWPLLCLWCPFCLDSNPESCRSKQVRYQLSHSSPFYQERFILPSTKYIFFSSVLYAPCFQCKSGSGFSWARWTQTAKNITPQFQKSEGNLLVPKRWKLSEGLELLIELRD